MQIYEEQFLFLLKTALNDEKLPDGYFFDVDRVFLIAGKHNLLPVIYSKAVECKDADLSLWKNTVMKLCGSQISKEVQFELICTELCAEGLRPVVVKGPVCANTYPVSHYRLSSDFDMIVKSENRHFYDGFFSKRGFVCKSNSYRSQELGLYIEISSELGEGNDKWAENADNAFDGFFERVINVGSFDTLSLEEHFVYLIYHAFKHFIGSGFGVKQLADIYMYIKMYQNEMDFALINELIEKIGIKSFSDNIFVAIDKIFGFVVDNSICSIDDSFVCYEDFLADLLDAGVFGKSTEDRLHSASLVRNAVVNEGKKNYIKTIFPSVSYMKEKYSILKKIIILLPIFWLLRIINYITDSLLRKKDSVSPAASVRIANNRLELMKNMGIL